MRSLLSYIFQLGFILVRAAVGGYYAKLIFFVCIVYSDLFYRNNYDY